MKESSKTQEELNESLFKAIMRNEVSAIDAALAEGADLTATTPKGNSALHVAATRKRRDAFLHLASLESNGKRIDLNNRNSHGATIVFELVKEGGMEFFLEESLKLGADPNIPAEDGMSPLIKAIAMGRSEEVGLLLRYGANVNYVMPDSKMTAFLMASSAVSGRTAMEICQMLVDAGADVTAIDLQGKNALLGALMKSDSMIRKEEIKDHKAVCDFLLGLNFDLNYASPSGMTAFWMASASHNWEVVEKMVEKGVDTNVWHTLGTQEKTSALHYLISGLANGKEPLIRKILDLGADINAPDAMGNTPAALGYANIETRDAVFELGGDVNAVYYRRDSMGGVDATPVISFVASSGDKQLELAEKMAAKGAKMSFADDPSMSDKEPAFVAIGANAPKLLKLFLDSEGANPNMVISTKSLGEMGMLGLIVSGHVNGALRSVVAKSKDIKRILDAKDENDKNGVKSDLINDEGFSELLSEYEKLGELEKELAANRKLMFDMLIEKGADPNLRTNGGNPPLFHSDSEESASWLLAVGADLFAKNDEGDDALIHALKTNSRNLKFFLDEFEKAGCESTKSLFYQAAFGEKGQYQRESMYRAIGSLYSEEDWKALNEKKDPSVRSRREEAILQDERAKYKDDSGNSAILVACAENNPFLVSLFRRLGADVNEPNDGGETPLMHAIASGNVELVEYLLENGANPNAVTVAGMSVLDFAEELDDDRILRKVKSAIETKSEESSDDKVDEPKAVKAKP